MWNIYFVTLGFGLYTDSVVLIPLEGCSWRLQLARSTSLPGDQQPRLSETFSGERKLGHRAEQWPDSNWGAPRRPVPPTLEAPHQRPVLPPSSLRSKNYSTMHSFHLSLFFWEGTVIKNAGVKSPVLGSNPESAISYDILDKSFLTFSRFSFLLWILVR